MSVHAWTKIAAFGIKGLRFKIYEALERDEEKWNPVFLASHATIKKLEQDDVSIKHHLALGFARGHAGKVFENSEPEPAKVPMQFP